jgi:hypothetical protein
MDCSICCNKLNKSTRKNITCSFCNILTCRECFQKYILSIHEDAHCMGCKKIFTRDFLSSNCTAVFLSKDYKKHRENILFDNEKSLMIETQPYVVIEKHRKNILKQVSEIEKEKAELMKLVNDKNLQIERLLQSIRNTSIVPSVEERRKFIRKCPIDDCRGFLNSQWNCAVCDSKICNLCNELKNENHVCNPDSVASMDLLNKDSKPCPECATIIFKISGCPQMFCTNCNTPWNWTTGNKITGVIHNPHYYQFVQNGGAIGRNHADIPCGGLPDVYEIRRLISTVKCSTNQTELIYSIHNVITHLTHHELRENRIDVLSFNRKLRVKYLMNELHEGEFKIILQSKEKERGKKNDFHNIYRMFIDVASDIFRQMIINKEINNQLVIIDNLINYFNTNVEKIGKIYKVVYPGIDKIKYRWHSNYNRFLIRN